MKPDKEFWHNDSIKLLFLKLCRNSTKPRVHWKTFRKLDKKGIFKDFNDVALSMKFRKLNLIDLGICWYCGEKPFIYESNHLCKNCDLKISKNNKYQMEKIKKKKNKKSK